jgi:hypothetical protein
MGEWHTFCVVSDTGVLARAQSRYSWLRPLQVSGQHCSEENDVSEYCDDRTNVPKVIQPLAMSDDERAGMNDLVLYGPFGADNEPLLEPFGSKPGAHIFVYVEDAGL